MMENESDASMKHNKKLSDDKIIHKILYVNTFTYYILARIKNKSPLKWGFKASALIGNHRLIAEL